MKLLSRLFARKEDPRKGVQALWHRVVELARDREWYAERGVTDTLEGRFDMITAVLSMVLLRLEREEGMAHPCVYLTELFVDDMEGQLRESGVGDVVVGKHMGRLMSALGGRLGAYRNALAQKGHAALEDAVARNLLLAEGASPAATAAGLRALYERLRAMPVERVLAAEI
ncbi:MAG TPA: ubiquinol-cytochrome C chaperone family protein [Sphingomonadaceae bacterium]|nr:ubiquinol-cytochrome C chaperone family protein [Sphingomonadaceae bacterium]